MKNGHLDNSDFKKLIVEKVRIKHNNRKIQKEIRRRIEQYLNENPEASTSDVENFIAETVISIKIPELPKELEEIDEHYDECFICRNKLNRIMGIYDDDLILRY